MRRNTCNKRLAVSLLPWLPGITKPSTFTSVIISVTDSSADILKSHNLLIRQRSSADMFRKNNSLMGKITCLVCHFNIWTPCKLLHLSCRTQVKYDLKWSKLVFTQSTQCTTIQNWFVVQERCTTCEETACSVFANLPFYSLPGSQMFENTLHLNYQRNNTNMLDIFTVTGFLKWIPASILHIMTTICWWYCPAASSNQFKKAQGRCIIAKWGKNALIVRLVLKAEARIAN